MGEETGKDDLKSLLDALKENAETVRTTYVAFLATAVYIWLTAESVTHEQLLNPENRISLPVIGVTLPVQGFFLVAPVLLFLFHLYFLLHVSHFAGQLAHAVKQFKDKGNDWKTLVHSSMFPTAFLAPETAGWMTLLLMNGIVYLSFFFSAPLILLRAQWQFLPYHDQFITLIHQCLVTPSIILSFACFFRIHWLKRRDESESPWLPWAWKKIGRWLTERPEFEPLRWIKRACVTLVYIFVFSVAYLSAALSLTVLTIPVTNQETFKLYNLPVAWAGLGIEYVRAAETNPGASHRGPKIDVRGSYLISGFFTRNLELSEKKLTVGPSDTLKAAYKDEPVKLLPYYKGLDLQDRDLQFGNFYLSDLTKADLRGAHLQGADLQDAHLESADLHNTHLQGADLSWVELRGVSLYGADFFDADLSELDIDENAIKLLSATIPESRRDQFRNHLRARNHEKATFSRVSSQIRHSKQKRLAKHPSLSPNKILQIRKEVYKPLLCEFPVLITEQVKKTETMGGLFSLDEIAGYVKDHCPERLYYLPPGVTASSPAPQPSPR